MYGPDHHSGYSPGDNRHSLCSPVEYNDVSSLCGDYQYLHRPATPLTLNSTHLIQHNDLVVCCRVLGTQAQRRRTQTEEGGGGKGGREGGRKDKWRGRGRVRTPSARREGEKGEDERRILVISTSHTCIYISPRDGTG